VPLDTTHMPIGLALKVERTAAGYSLTEIAKAVGVSPGHLSHIEAGRRVASTELIVKIRAAIASDHPAVAL